MEWVLISIAVLAAANGGVHFLRTTGERPSFPILTLLLAVITASFSIAGNLAPDLLANLGRNRDALLGGEWWRLVTPLVVQDGGWAGTVFNLVTLLVVGTLVETIYGKRLLVAVYLLAGLGSEIMAYTVLPNQGFAGNSVADMGLTALCLITYIVVPRTLAQLFGVIGLTAGAVLVVTANLHGVGFALGAVVGVVLVALSSRVTSPTAVFRGRRQEDRPL